jgi:hypothetical protein
MKYVSIYFQQFLITRDEFNTGTAVRANYQDTLISDIRTGDISIGTFIFYALKALRGFNRFSAE